MKRQLLCADPISSAGWEQAALARPGWPGEIEGVLKSLAAFRPVFSLLFLALCYLGAGLVFCSNTTLPHLTNMTHPVPSPLA